MGKSLDDFVFGCVSLSVCAHNNSSVMNENKIFYVVRAWLKEEEINFLGQIWIIFWIQKFSKLRFSTHFQLLWLSV